MAASATLDRQTGRFLIVGDLHQDFWADLGRDPFAPLPPGFFADLDGILIAGDFTNKPKVRWPHAFDWLSRYIPLDRVFVLPGNHDYYDFRLDGDDRLAEIAAAAGARFLQDSEILYGRARLLCTTLWTDFELGAGLAVNAAAAEARVSDFRTIRVGGSGYRRIRATDLARRHRAHLDWLERRLATPHDGETVVVTHHAPLPDAAGDDALAACFASDLGAVIDRHRPARWIFGHTHKPYAATRGRTEIRNVSFGYPDELTDDAVAARLTPFVFELGG